MKIAISTYHRAHNYGALLQGYALKTYLEQKGHQVEFLDYWPEDHIKEYQLIPYFKERSFLSKVKSILLLLMGYSITMKRRAKYFDFMFKYMGLSKDIRFITHEDLNKKLDYDLIVYGSDQIWRKANNLILKGFDSVYFGDYPLHNTKITYAASMGVIDLKEADQVFVKSKIKNFKGISVREMDLQDALFSLTDQKFPLVLDPVFLLDKNEWKALFPEDQTLKNRKYIFFYHLIKSEETLAFVDKLAKSTGLEVIEVRGRADSSLKGSRYFHEAGPIDFANLIRYAEYVVSTSFHGVVFSLVFEKEFYAMGMGKNSGRVKTLLTSFGISNRLINDVSKVKFEDKIDYDLVNKKIEERVRISKEYLNNQTSKVI